MDEDNRGNQKRTLSSMPMNEQMDFIHAFFGEMYALLQAHGFSVTDREARNMWRNFNVSQREKEMALRKSECYSYEEFQHIALQSLDGFMIILSVDGIIIFVTDNVSTLLGYSPNDIVGKTLLSLLPENEKTEVYGKIALKYPVSSMVGKHNEFCCHLRRPEVQSNDCPTYEFVKFIMSIKDLDEGPLALLKTCFPRHSYNIPLAVHLPVEDRFYMVGTVCVIRSQILKEISGIKKTDEEVIVIQDSDEESLSTDDSLFCSSLSKTDIETCSKLPSHEGPDGLFYRYGAEQLSLSVPSQWRHRMQRMMRCQSLAAAKDDEVEIMSTEKCGSQERIPLINTDSDISSVTSISDARSPGDSSSQNFEFKFEVRRSRDVVSGNEGKVEEVYKITEEDQREEEHKVYEGEDEEEKQDEDESEGEDEADEEEEEDEVDQMDEPAQEEDDEDKMTLVDKMEETLHERSSSSTDFADTSEAQLSEIPLSIRAYIKKRELMLTNMFKEQLEEKTQHLQADLKIQQHAVDTMKEQLRSMQETNFQTMLTTLRNTDSSRTRSFEPLFKRHRAETVKTILPDLNVTTYFDEPCLPYPSECPEELEESGSVWKPEQHLQCNIIRGNQALQICLPNQAGLSEPFSDDSIPSMQTQPLAVPLQFVSQQQPQPSGYYPDENLGGQREKSHSVCSKEQQGSSMIPLPLAFNPNFKTTSASCPESDVASDSNVRLEIPQEYFHIRQQLLTPQQGLVPEAGPQKTSKPEDFQDPAEDSSKQVSSVLSGKKPDLQEKVQEQCFHIKH